LNNTLLNDQGVIEEIREEKKSSWNLMVMKTTTHQNLWNTAKAVLRGKFIGMSAYIKRSEKSQISDLMVHLKCMEKQEKPNLKTSRRREIIKIRTEINEIETTTTTKNHTKNQ
jgi:hypothetical protein